MLTKFIQFLHSLLFKLHLWLQCLLLTPSYSRKRTNAGVERVNNETEYFRNQKKPDWVVREVIRLKAFMTHSGCRVIANYAKSPQEIILWQGVLAGYYWEH